MRLPLFDSLIFYSSFLSRSYTAGCLIPDCPLLFCRSLIKITASFSISFHLIKRLIGIPLNGFARIFPIRECHAHT